MSAPKWAERAAANDELIRRALDTDWFALRIEPRLKPEGDCLLWTGANNDYGYGIVGIPSAIKRNPVTIVRVHRVAYIHEHGSIPFGMTLDHLCRVRSCANPAHMEPVTLRTNLNRSDLVGRRPSDMLATAEGLIAEQWGGVR